ncbi:MAG: AAA family ATPase [Clostridiales bacterium]|nr:AAA family ATPase [Clostridiales bacterium]
MSITGLRLENFTVFKKIELDFTDGINIFIGENGTGKTHIMKILYSACQTAREDVMFSHKLVKVLKPDRSSINRFLSKNKVAGSTLIVVHSKKCLYKNTVY